MALPRLTSTGAVTGDRDVGGLIGVNSGDKVGACYSVGQVSGSIRVGGLIGTKDSGITMSDAYWDRETSGQVTSADGSGRSTRALKQKSTFRRWDFTNVWDIQEGVSYPFFRSNLVEDSNSQPALSFPDTPIVVNESERATYQVPATDSDIPANTLSYALIRGPRGMRINSVTGFISWAPGETTGGTEVEVTVRVTDNGEPPMSTTDTFTLFVKETNTSPTLSPIANAAIDELTVFQSTATATDPDLPPNDLTFSLVNAPSCGHQQQHR